MDRDQEIRVLAHSLWEQEGRPEGRDQDHWYRAEAIWSSQHIAAVETNGQPHIAGPAAFEPVASGSVDRHTPPKQGHRRRHHRPG